jgi:predicted kinase
MLIAMAGLPASGKSTIAARLAEELAGVLLSKDQVRAALFPSAVLDYSSTEDDISMAAIYQAVAYIRTTFPPLAVIVDGRTFLRAYQVRDLLDLAAALHETARIVECVCSEAVAGKRLEHEVASGTHPAKNRTCALYRALKEQAEPITLPHLIVDTSSMPVEDCVQRCLAYLRAYTA